MNRFLWTSYGMYFLGGVNSVFFGAILSELLAHYNVSYTAGGTLILLQSIGFIVGVPLTAAFMRKHHYRFILSGSALLVAIAQFGVLGLPHFYVLAFLVILNGIGTSSLETAVASYVMELFEGRRAISMSRLEVAFGAGALCMPIIASVLIAAHMWRFSALLVGIFALVLAIIWQTISVSLQASPSEEGHMDARTAEAPVFKGAASKYGILMLFLLIIFVYVGMEGSLNSFLPSIFTTGLGTSPYFASLSTSVFWVAMLLGRLCIGWIIRHVSYERYLFASMLLGMALVLFLTQSGTVWLSFLIIFGLGLGLSGIYSITMVYANHTFPGMERTVTSAVTAFAGIGGAVFPFIIGFGIDHFSTQQVLWMLFGFSLLLFLAFLVITFSLNTIRKQSLSRKAG
ncbi:MFS transporter [Metabacillus sp. GX 13764]|uniref:MFS transporter n=1 Tax=Metabacillus kandeliae TaxID=2900151 RepID=UPI001E4E50DF|nr:MFS transporter [Metabacillus kandeliae]MCD7035692.1 MFS transporter [Metabacillus kandeliae]